MSYLKFLLFYHILLSHLDISWMVLPFHRFPLPPSYMAPLFPFIFLLPSLMAPRFNFILGSSSKLHFPFLAFLAFSIPCIFHSLHSLLSESSSFAFLYSPISVVLKVLGLPSHLFPFFHFYLLSLNSFVFIQDPIFYLMFAFSPNKFFFLIWDFLLLSVHPFLFCWFPFRAIQLLPPSQYQTFIGQGPWQVFG